jgi:protein O-GlcNAc transferase
MPKVSVGLPVFNDARYIGATIACLKSQTLSDFEVIIGDNCSTDETHSICKAAVGGDERFRLVRHPTNIGASGNFEYVYRCASSAYFMWLGGHDLITDNTLHSLCDILDNHSEISMAMGYPYAIGADERAITERPRAVYKFSEHKQTRYLQSVEWLTDCTIFHSLFRTNILRLFSLKQIISLDHIGISRLLWHGNISYSNKCKYIRREKSTQTQMETITGRIGASDSRYEFAKAYIADFEELYDGSVADRERCCTEILVRLVYRFGPSCLRDRETSSHQTKMEYLFESVRGNSAPINDGGLLRY